MGLIWGDHPARPCFRMDSRGRLPGAPLSGHTRGCAPILLCALEALQPNRKKNWIRPPQGWLPLVGYPQT